MSTATQSRIRDIPLADIDRWHNHRIPIPGDDERIEALKQSIEDGNKHEKRGQAGGQN